MTIERIDYQAGSVRGKGALIWNEKVSGRRPLLLEIAARVRQRARLVGMTGRTAPE